MPIIFETFGNPEDQIKRLLVETPTAFNGLVRVERYRVTIERIEEAEGVLKGRLCDLLDQPGQSGKDAHVHKAAKALGIKLD